MKSAVSMATEDDDRGWYRARLQWLPGEWSGRDTMVYWWRDRTQAALLSPGGCAVLTPGVLTHQPALGRYAIHDLARIQLRIAFAMSQ